MKKDRRPILIKMYYQKVVVLWNRWRNFRLKCGWKSRWNS